MKFIVLVLMFCGVTFGAGQHGVRHEEYGNLSENYPFIKIDIVAQSALIEQNIRRLNDQIKLVSDSLQMNKELKNKAASQVLDDLEREMGIYVPTPQDLPESEPRMDQEGRDRLLGLIRSQESELVALKKKKRDLLIERLEIAHGACIMALGSEKGSSSCKENILAPNSDQINRLKQMNRESFVSSQFKTIFDAEWEKRKLCFQNALRECSNGKKGCCDKPLYHPRDMIVFSTKKEAAG